MKDFHVKKRYTRLDHARIYRDVSYIEETYGPVWDYCGAWCNNDQMTELLKSPTYTTGFNALYSMLRIFFVRGYDGAGHNLILPVDEDKKLKAITRRWGINVW